MRGRASLDVLVVTASGHRVGIPADQVQGLRRTDEPLPGLFSGADVLTGAALDGAKGSFGVDAVGDLMSLPLASVHPLPGVIARHALPAFFGAAVVAEGLLLLVDLDRLSS